MTSSDKQLLASSPIYKGVRRHNSCPQNKKESWTNKKSSNFLRSVRELRSHGKLDSPHWGDIQRDIHTHWEPPGSRSFCAISSWYTGLWAWENLRVRIPGNPAWSLLPEIPAGSHGRDRRKPSFMVEIGENLLHSWWAVDVLKHMETILFSWQRHVLKENYSDWA